MTLARLTASLATCAALAACANGGDRPPPRAELAELPLVITAPEAMLFLEMDENRDRRIDAAELARGQARAWAELAGEADETSLVSVRDWLVDVLGSAEADLRFLNFDPDFNQRVTRLEFDAALAARFRSRDLDADGALARSELLIFVERRRIEQNPTGGPGG